MTTGLKVILAGYHQPGIHVLNHLMSRSDVSALQVYTHKPGSGVPDLRDEAARHGVPCSTRNISRVELPFTPDIIASVWYRKIIKPHVIQACRGQIFNVHPALLPRHRGCSSVPWAIIEGDTVTGVTYHYIDEAVDTGRILMQATLQIAPDETQTTLYPRAMDLAALHWPAAFELVRAGYPGVEQSGDGCYHPRGAPADGQIDPTWPDATIERFIRAMQFAPLPPARFEGHDIHSMDQYLAIRPGS